jgi:tetratricopeptide (TPR) repeat protein
MAGLESLLNDIANLDAQHDLDGLRRIREQIVAEHPDSDAAVEAQYKIGLDLLFRQRDLAGAVAKFEVAAQHKHPYWSAAARTSAALCYYHQKRTQKAVFELRKVAYPEEPNAHSVTALAFLETIFANEGQRDEVRRVRRDRVGQLEELARLSRERNLLSDRGYYLYLLGLALRDQGEDGRANALLEDVKNLGPEILGADLYRSVLEALGR